VTGVGPIRNLRLVVLIISFLLLVTVSHGQTYVFGRTDLPVAPGAFSVASGDFNGDGIIDLVSVSQGGNTVSVVLGNVNGGFNSPVSYPTGSAPSAVVSGDFNGDGILDLAVTNSNCAYQTAGMADTELVCNAGTVSILLGNGDGSFQPHLDYATGKNPSALAAADFNADGKLDLAIVNAEDGSISVLLGQGDGTFQSQVVYKVPGAQGLVIGDFNNDHKLDLVVSGPTTLLGNGDGTFQAPITYAGGYVSGTGSPLAAADFNLDGKLDLYEGGAFFLGNGDGTFVLHAVYSAAGNGNSGDDGGAAAVDLNGDGKPDLVIADGNGVEVLLGNGDGNFQTPLDYSTTTASDVLVADLNGDGRLDLAVAESGCPPYNCPAPGSASLSLLLGVGDGTFVGGRDYAFTANYPATQVVSADFNGDGKPDFAAETNFVPVGATTPLSVYLGNGDGTLQAQIPTTIPQNTGFIAAADLNADGKADVATVYVNCNEGGTTCQPGDLVVLIGNGDGTFQSPVEYAVGLEPEDLTVGDFNGDGKPDVATANFASDTISILLNNGNGTFQTHVDYPTGLQPEHIISGDFNGDGKLDLVTLTQAGISLHLGNGDGTFRPHQDYAVNNQGIALAAGDFNGDGKLDLALTTASAPEVFVLLGNGDGTFQTPITSAGAEGFLAVGDFNGDGKPDLFIASEYSGGSEVLLGNGDGTFRQPILSFLAAGAGAVMDLNHDGIPDIVASTAYATAANEISVLLSTPFKAVAPASLNFGSQGVGTVSAPETITISNPASVSFNITNVAAGGDYSQTNDCGGSLAAGAHCTITVSFSPTKTGSDAGTITLSDSTKASPLAIPLTGSGVNGPALTADPARAIFPSQSVGTSSKPVPVMLVNTGNSGLSITGISLAGTDSSDFAEINNCGGSLAAGGSCTVNVTFTPTAGGSRMASLAISGTEPGSPQLVELAGTAVGAAVKLSPITLTFASETLGSTSAAQTSTLANIGNAPLNITGISASGDFAQTNTCGTSLAIGGSCQISVTFAPSAVGNRTGSITIAQSGGGSPQSIALSGIGVAAPDFTIGLASGSQASQTIPAGQNAQFSIAIAPAGTFTGTVNLSCSVTPAATPAPICSLSNSAVQLSGTALTVTVTIATAAPKTASHSGLPFGGAPVAWAAMLLGTLLPWKRKRPLLMAIVFITLVGASFVGCGGGGSSSPPQTTPGTTAGSYTANITATSDSLSHNTTMTVVVQ
jgi:FG-GAP-like repeat/Abnormal spindle-like microcephaly-assoc'd, ASPM-SPD-2-Hydin